MKAYTYRNGFLNLFGYTVRGGFVPCGKTSQKELHDHAFSYVNKHFEGRDMRLEPAKGFLLKVAEPDKIPTKEEFDQWMKKKKVVEALEDMK